MARIKWTLERLKEDALKYSTRTEWCKNSSGAYGAASKKGLLDECCSHMQCKQKPYGYWSPDNIQKDALKYKSRSEWENKSRSAYYAAQRLGLLDECCGHMPLLKNHNGYWTLERLKEDALKYKTRNEWKKQSSKAYSAAKNKRLIDECCGHMPKRAKRK